MPPPSRFKLNPAFSAAHGIDEAPAAAARRPQAKTKSRIGTGANKGAASGGGRNMNGGRSNTKPPTSSNKNNPPREAKVQAALRTARMTGRLILCDCSLTSLPAQMFDLRSGIEIDLSLDSASNPGRRDSRGEEELTSIDVSDNDFSGATPSALDERVEKFRSVSIFRARRSKLSNVPWRSLGMLDCLTVLDLSGNELSGNAAVECLPAVLRELNLSGNRLTGLTSFAEEDGEGGSGSDGVATFAMPHLLSLNISNNQLESLPPSFVAPVLQTFNFSDNQITSLPTNLLVRSSKSLSTLEGGGNRITSPPDLRGYQSLRIVDLGRNALTEPPAVDPSLVRLSLEGNRLTNIRNLFGGAQIDRDDFRSSLTELRISSNCLVDLDEDVARCLTNIAMIDASMNDLPDLPRCVGYLPALRRITMDGNPCLRRIRNQLLNDGSALKAFLRMRGPPPPGEGYMDGPPVEGGAGGSSGGGGGGGRTTTAASTGSSGDSGGGGAAGASRQTKATNGAWRNTINDALVGTCRLNLSNKKIDSLPEDLRNELMAADTSAVSSSRRRDCVGGFGGIGSGGGDDGAMIDTVGKRIRRLDLSNNALTSLDDGFFDALPNLVRLDAVKNRVETLPEKMADVPLVEISMSQNRLTSEAVARSVLCRCVGNSVTMMETALSRSLTTLDLSGNRLEWFPSEICNLPNLARLNLSGNGIQTLAASSSGEEGRGWVAQSCPPSLESLDLSSNKISNLGDLPDSLAACGSGSLRSLLLSNNELRTLPPTLGDLRSLTTIDLRGNPQRGIRPAVLVMGCEDILSYLRGRKAPVAATTTTAAKSRAMPGATNAAKAKSNAGGRIGGSKEVAVPQKTGGVNSGGVGVDANPVAPAAASSSNNTTGNGNDDAATSQQKLEERVSELTQTVDDFRMKLNNVHLSEAMKYKMKKDMAKHRAELIREERKLRALRG